MLFSMLSQNAATPKKHVRPSSNGTTDNLFSTKNASTEFNKFVLQEMWQQLQYVIAVFTLRF